MQQIRHIAGIAVALAAFTGAALGQSSEGACQIIYEEARSTLSCIAYEAFVQTCADHPLLPVANLYISRECSDAVAAQAPAEPTFDFEKEMAQCRAQDGASEYRVLACTSVITSNPEKDTLIEAYVLLAQVHLNASNELAALDALDRLLQNGVMDGDYAYIYEFYQGSALQRLGRNQEALSFIESATEEKAQRLLLLSKAKALKELNRRDDAIALLRDIVFDKETDAANQVKATHLLNELDADPAPLLTPILLIREMYGLDEGTMIPADTAATEISDRNPYIVPRFAALLRADEQREFPLVDFDPMVNGQDAKITELKIDWRYVEVDGQLVNLVKARFKNFDTPNVVSYSFVRDNNIWKLADIWTEDWSLVKILSEIAPVEVTSPVSPAPIHRCDELAAHPTDPGAVAPSVDFDDLNAGAAVSACLAAIEQYPDEARFYYQLGRAHDKSKNYKPATMSYGAAAERGYGRAMSAIATLYRNGDGTEKNRDLATEFEILAAEAGYVPSMYIVGEAYQDGLYIVKDLKKAFYWFLKSAENRDLKGMQAAGYFYSNGIGTVEDDTKARSWYERAAEGGRTQAMTNLAFLLDRGEGGPREPVLAANYLFTAVRAGGEKTLERLSSQPPQFSKEVFEALQWELKNEGLYFGNVDGKSGPKTISALEALFKG